MRFLYYFLYIPIYLVWKCWADDAIKNEFEIWLDKLRVNYQSDFRNFMFLIKQKEYRSVLYWRMGKKGKLLKIITPPHPVLFIETPSSKVGMGLVIHHGHSSVVHANYIGKNCQIWQNVTIGKEKPGGSKPSIGDNVYIYTGAVVIGNITVGDNVVIGANTVISKSIPDNCTVVGNPAKIIRRNGIRVNEKL